MSFLGTNFTSVILMLLAQPISFLLVLNAQKYINEDFSPFGDRGK
jgi:hypothetical protein